MIVRVYFSQGLRPVRQDCLHTQGRGGNRQCLTTTSDGNSSLLLRCPGFMNSERNGARLLKLTKELSRREMLEVWGILLDLRKRTKDRGEDDDDHILFAIGDWLNTAEERFGSFLQLVTASGIPRPRAIISYKHQDPIRDGWVRKLFTDLRERYGIDVRLDEFEVNYGQSFSDYMTSEIDRDSDASLFVITLQRLPRSTNSTPVPCILRFS